MLPAAAVCGVAFAGTQFVISNFVGAQLTDILASLAAMGASAGDPPPRPSSRPASGAVRHPARAMALAWSPHALLVVFVLLWGYLLVVFVLLWGYNPPSSGLAWTISSSVIPLAAGLPAISRRLQVHLALGLRHRLPVRGHSGGRHRGTEAGQFAARARPHRAGNWRWRN